MVLVLVIRIVARIRTPVSKPSLALDCSRCCPGEAGDSRSRVRCQKRFTFGTQTVIFTVVSP